MNPVHAIDPMDTSEASRGPCECDRNASVMRLVPPGIVCAWDVGVRDGFLSVELTKKVRRVVALDLMAPNIEQSRATVIARDAMHLPFPDDTFDRAICTEDIEHIASSGLESACWAPG